MMKKRNINRCGAALFVLFCGVALFLSLGIEPAAAEVTDEDCLGCHSDKELEAETARGKTLNLFVPPNALDGSAHEGLSCTDCHQGESEAAFEEIPHGKTPLKFKCAECHDDVYAGFLKEDVHGLALTKGNPRAPSCMSCHGGHDIFTAASGKGRMSKKNQADSCGDCHGREKLNLEDNITKRNLIKRFKDSVHHQASMAGKNGASCTDCHSHHNILSSAAPQSTVARATLSAVCSKCHPEIVKGYNTGPHGRSLRHGNHDVPNCTTCHGDHDMASLRSRQGDAKQWASTQVCVWCHNNERMMARYGLDTIPVKSYMQDFHGLTQRGSLGASATCSDCHDPHYSLPSDHPKSRMHISNRGTACGQCHGKVSDNFAQSFTHRKAMEKPGTKIENIIRKIYILIILLSVGGMFFYNFLIWFHAVRVKFKKQRAEKHVNRMSRAERIFHFTLLFTFVTLVITGFALKFPEAFWAKWLFAIGMTEGVRAGIHRTAGFLMTFDLIAIFVYMAVARRGRGMLFEIL
ncbi:MAG: hypothetical protein GY765_38935, partial [bacterium]|nr:hypothetical protein [bacterium]